MSTHERFEVEPPTPPPPGRSTASKILLGCGIGCGVIVVLCCGALAAIVYWGERVLPRYVERDPAAVRSVTDQIATIDVPPDLKPEASLALKVPFTGQPLVTFAVYTGEGEDEVLGLAEIPGPPESADQKQLQQRIDEALTGRSKRGPGDDFKPAGEPQKVEVQIRGAPAKFEIEEGEIKSGKKMIRAMGQFKGHNGTSLLFLQLDAEKHDSANVEQLLRSIQ
jgi:hypothetical protein